MRHYERYVAIGDSTSEGLDDPDGQGGYRGWANRFAEHVAAHQGGLLYANLAVRGRRVRQIHEQQLDLALAMRPDLSTVVGGVNDILHPRFDADAVRFEMEAMQRAMVSLGVTVLTFTLPTMSHVLPLTKWLDPRVHALNDALRGACAATGAILVDLAAHEDVGSDPRMWSIDRLHANSLGHERIAWALSHAIGLPGATDEWTVPLPTAQRPSLLATLRSDAHWMRRYMIPWIWRHSHGRSSGDGLRAKRPKLLPVTIVDDSQPQHQGVRSGA
ncbi:MAG: SGNH/GDSL hydrolase family protein [Gemmatimonadaceae bacterium]